MNKTITISIAGTDGRDAKDVELLPGTKARDVLTQLNLNGFQIEKPGGGCYRENEPVVGREQLPPRFCGEFHWAANMVGARRSAKKNSRAAAVETRSRFLMTSAFSKP